MKIAKGAWTGWTADLPPLILAGFLTGLVVSLYDDYRYAHQEPIKISDGECRCPKVNVDGQRLVGSMVTYGPPDYICRADCRYGP